MVKSHKHTHPAAFANGKNKWKNNESVASVDCRTIFFFFSACVCGSLFVSFAQIFDSNSYIYISSSICCVPAMVRIIHVRCVCVCVMFSANCICFSLIIWNLLSSCSVTLFIVYWITSYISVEEIHSLVARLAPPRHTNLNTKNRQIRQTIAENGSVSLFFFCALCCCVQLRRCESQKQTNRWAFFFLSLGFFFAQRSFGPTKTTVKSWRLLNHCIEKWCTHYSSWIDGFVRWTDEKAAGDRGWNILPCIYLYIILFSLSRLFRFSSDTLTVWKY